MSRDSRRAGPLDLQYLEKRFSSAFDSPFVGAIHKQRLARYRGVVRGLGLRKNPQQHVDFLSRRWSPLLIEPSHVFVQFLDKLKHSLGQVTRVMIPKERPKLLYNRPRLTAAVPSRYGLQARSYLRWLSESMLVKLGWRSGHRPILKSGFRLETGIAAPSPGPWGGWVPQLCRHPPALIERDHHRGLGSEIPRPRLHQLTAFVEQV